MKTTADIAGAISKIGDEFGLPTGAICDALWALDAEHAAERERLEATIERLKSEGLEALAEYAEGEARLEARIQALREGLVGMAQIKCSDALQNCHHMGALLRLEASKLLGADSLAADDASRKG